MECPTFGGEDGRLKLCVQSLDRMGEFTTSNDRHKVLINRAPKRYRSITAMNFFERPPPSDLPPVPPLPIVLPVKRPPPKFLEVFKPLSAEENTSLVPSNASTPSASMPVTPSSPRQELHPRGVRSYFLVSPSHHYERNRTIMNESSALLRPLQCSDILSHDKDEVAVTWQEVQEKEQQDQQREWNVLSESTQSDQSIVVWATRPPEHKKHDNALMMDGTFGRM